MGKASNSAAKTAEPGAPKGRSKLKLAMLAVAPLALAGAGYAGWTQYAGAKAAPEAETHGDGHAGAGWHD